MSETIQVEVVEFNEDTHAPEIRVIECGPEDMTADCPPDEVKYGEDTPKAQTANSPERMEDDDTDSEPPEETPILKPDPTTESQEPCDEASTPKPKLEVTPPEPTQGKSKGFSRTSEHSKYKRRRPPTLLEKILAKDIQEERSQLLQCVKFICEKDFFGIGQKESL